MKKIVVLGAGESGRGTAILAQKMGWEVLVSDAQKIPETTRVLLDEKNIEWEEGHSIDRILTADVVMKSPGIPHHVPVVKAIREAEIPIQSEIEFASQYTKAKIIGITGSNGKTTTALLTYHLLKEAGLDVCLAGNIGYSFAQKVAETTPDYFVLEISSFQLDDIHSFAPEIAVITNITPDHLDRYNNDFSAYVDAKLKITAFQHPHQFLLFNSDDPVLREALKNKSSKAKVYAYGVDATQQPEISLEKNNIHIQLENDTTMLTTTQFPLQGRHNLLNTMAAVSVARILDISKSTIRESLLSFKGAAHRLEPVLKIQNVNYINDSKATNVNATYFALESMQNQTVWIVGGVDKGNDYSCLLPLVNEKVKAIICLGKENEKLLDAFAPVVDLIIETQSMKEAVRMAHELTQPKETVLLSPACASFDLFENYEDRGDQFKAAVRNL